MEPRFPGLVLTTGNIELFHSRSRILVPEASLSLSLSLSHTHTQTYERTHVHAHSLTHTHTLSLSYCLLVLWENKKQGAT